MIQWIRRHPVAAYMAIAFGWAWTIVFGMLLSGADSITLTPAFMIGGLTCNIAPSLAAFAVTRATRGKEGVRALKDRLKVKNAPWLYLLTGLIVPGVSVAVTLFSSQAIRSYTLAFNAGPFIAGLVWPLFSGFGEEFGWRGFVLPRMLEHLPPVAAGLLLGFVWEVWHLPMHYMGYMHYGQYMIPTFIATGFVNLMLQSLLMTLIWVRGKGDLKMMILYHFTITSSALMISGIATAAASPRLALAESILSDAVFAVVALVLWWRWCRRPAGEKSRTVSDAV